jgi:hypothetical protein
MIFLLLLNNGRKGPEDSKRMVVRSLRNIEENSTGVRLLLVALSKQGVSRETIDTVIVYFKRAFRADKWIAESINRTEADRRRM